MSKCPIGYYGSKTFTKRGRALTATCNGKLLLYEILNHLECDSNCDDCISSG